MIILKCHVINFHGVTCKVMECHVNLIILFEGVIKDALDYKSDIYKKNHSNMFNYGSHMTKIELGVKSTC